jgi:predicted nucleotidyltransferase
MNVSPRQAELRAIAERYRLGAVYVFGSRATEIVKAMAGETVESGLPASDVDIGVQPATIGCLAARDRVGLAADLEDLLAVGRVDIVVLPEADPFLALDVIRGELLYCADRDLQAEEELHILRRAADLAPFARERWKQMLAGAGL